jgi:hypothetical protein
MDSCDLSAIFVFQPTYLLALSPLSYSHSSYRTFNLSLQKSSILLIGCASIPLQVHVEGLQLEQHTETFPYSPPSSFKGAEGL